MGIRLLTVHRITANRPDGERKAGEGEDVPLDVGEINDLVVFQIAPAKRGVARNRIKLETRDHRLDVREVGGIV